jgi:uncharacterized membrane protein YcaP (DUF421 family)
VMRREKITHHELMSSLRAAGCATPIEVHFAILENNGYITVQPKKGHENDHIDQGGNPGLPPYHV